MLTYHQIIQKTITLDKALNLLNPDFRKKNKMVFTNGCFDIIHRGHIYYLSKARELGDLLIVGLNSDASVAKLKGPGRPVNKQEARAEILGALAFVDYIIVFEQETPLDLISALEPDLLVKGGDYKVEDIVGYREVTSRGGSVVTIPLLEGYSSSSIIQRNNP
jgi:rfaE bifunctional protein nucleotidyltransferase chain/domain